MSSERRHAARGRRRRRRREAFPLRAPRLVDVHVRVDETRHHDRVADVGDRNAGRGSRGLRVSRDHRGDAPAEDAQRGRTNPLRPHHAPAAQEKLAHGLPVKRILGRWNSVTPILCLESREGASESPVWLESLRCRRGGSMSRDILTGRRQEAACERQAFPNTKQHGDGRVELIDSTRIEASPLYNKDLAPVPVARRNWTTYNYAALWISMAHCIPTYMLASGLMTAGMNWWQALVTILLGNTIVLVPILLNSHPGTQYGIPFPVFARARPTARSARTCPALMRALVACGWFGIQSWIGGEALYTLFTSLMPSLARRFSAPGPAGHTTTAVALLPPVLGTQRLHHLPRHGPAAQGRELGGAFRPRDDDGPPRAGRCARRTVRAAPRAAAASSRRSAEFLPVFIPSLTAMIGYWATLSLNMPDFTRFGRSQREQMVGQVVALPTTMSVFAAMGVMITSATVLIYGQAIWDPIQLVAPLQGSGRRRDLDVHGGRRDARRQHRRQRRLPGQRLRQRLPALDRLQDRRPHHGHPRHPDAALEAARRRLGLHLHVAARLLGRPRLDRRRAHRRLLAHAQEARLKLEDLYLTHGVYRYDGGWNWKAVVATLVGCGLAWGGLVVPALKPLYSYAWFVGFLASGALYSGR